MWFSVDKDGLRKIMERRGKSFVVHELVQNALDEPSTRIDVSLERINSRQVRLAVEDDSPNGFQDLSHSFTLFAESRKKSNAEQRGRFCLGDKLVLALCSTARISSTRGGVRFDATGRHHLRTKRAAGSLFEGVMTITNDEMAEIASSMARLLVPPTKRLFFNGAEIAPREPLKVVHATLATEIAAADGSLRPARRRTQVHIHDPLHGEGGLIYEMGIPVAPTGDRYSVDVQQKVPLSLDRDSVPASYLAALRGVVLEHMATDGLTPADATSTWVRDALEHCGDRLPADVVRAVAVARFGDKAVVYDPSDPEANSRAASAGYTVVTGGQLSAPEWAAFRAAGALAPAGRVLPSPKPFSEDGSPIHLLPTAEWTPAMHHVAALSRSMGAAAAGVSYLRVDVARAATWPYLATYTRESDSGGRLIFNMGRLGRSWFDGPLDQIIGLIAHELAHHASSDHLSDRYHDAICSIAGRVAVMALDSPSIFRDTQQPAGDAAA